MDLNLQYSEHQQSLMRAMACASGTMRTRHLESAGSVARDIQAWQQAKGANAAIGWSQGIDDADLLELSIQRTPA